MPRGLQKARPTFRSLNTNHRPTFREKFVKRETVALLAPLSNAAGEHHAKRRPTQRRATQRPSVRQTINAKNIPMKLQELQEINARERMASIRTVIHNTTQNAKLSSQNSHQNRFRKIAKQIQFGMMWNASSQTHNQMYLDQASDLLSSLSDHNHVLSDSDGELSPRYVEGGTRKLMTADYSYSHDLNTVHTSANSKHFNFENERESTVYRRQGNSMFYTADAQKKRQDIKNSPLIAAAIEEFWRSIPSVKDALRDGKGSAQVTITKDEYLEFEVRICKALFEPEDFTVEEALSAAETDWSSAETNGETMSHKSFFFSLFEVADIWTDSMQEEDYMSFLKMLFGRIIDHVEADTHDGHDKQYEWLPTEKIQYLPPEDYEFHNSDDEEVADNRQNSLGIQLPELTVTPLAAGQRSTGAASTVARTSMIHQLHQKQNMRRARRTTFAKKNASDSQQPAFSLGLGAISEDADEHHDKVHVKPVDVSSITPTDLPPTMLNEDLAMDAKEADIVGTASIVDSGRSTQSKKRKKPSKTHAKLAHANPEVHHSYQLKASTDNYKGNYSYHHPGKKEYNPLAGLQDMEHFPTLDHLNYDVHAPAPPSTAGMSNHPSTSGDFSDTHTRVQPTRYDVSSRVYESTMSWRLQHPKIPHGSTSFSSKSLKRTNSKHMSSTSSLVSTASNISTASRVSTASSSKSKPMRLLEQLDAVTLTNPKNAHTTLRPVLRCLPDASIQMFSAPVRPVELERTFARPKSLGIRKAERLAQTNSTPKQEPMHLPPFVAIGGNFAEHFRTWRKQRTDFAPDMTEEAVSIVRTSFCPF